MNLDDAILAHYAWKNKLKAAITARSQLDAATISRDDCCEFGKWLHGAGGQLYKGRVEFTALLQKHKVFHAEAGKVATAINSGHYDEASHMIESSTPFGTASLAVGMAVNTLKRIAA